MATKKATTTKTTVAPKKAAAKQTTTVSAKSKVMKKPRKVLSPEEKGNLIAVAAYYIAERRGFAPGNEHDDWLEAEKQVEIMLAEGSFE